MIKICKPIFINGCPRSGTTVFSKLLCYHPDLAWFSNYTTLFPFLPQLALFSRIHSIIKPVSLKKIDKVAPSITEAWNIWRKCCSEDFLYKPLDESDVNSKSIDCLTNIIKKHLMYQGKTRFITKITGPPKIRYLNKIFSDSLFVYVIRDGRAVVNSLLNVGFWKNMGGYEKPWWGDLPQDYENKWIESGKSKLILAALQWKYMIDLYFEEKKHIGENRYLFIRYEDICKNPNQLMREVVEFCDLDWNADFEEHIKSIPLRNMNYKWKEKMTLEQKQLLDDVLGSYLIRLGYEKNVV